MPVKSSIIAKTLKFNIEPQRENITESQSLECPAPSLFSHLIGQVAETAEEKYRILEQRDKVLRQGKATSHCGVFRFSAWHEQLNTWSSLCQHRSTKEDRPRHVKGVCGDMSWYVPREGAIHARNTETTERIWSHPRHWDGISIFRFYPEKSILCHC